MRKLTVKVALVLPGFVMVPEQSEFGKTCSKLPYMFLYALRANVREEQSSALLLESFKCLTITWIYSYLERMQQSRASWGTPAGDRNFTSSSRHSSCCGCWQGAHSLYYLMAKSILQLFKLTAVWEECNRVEQIVCMGDMSPCEPGLCVLDEQVCSCGVCHLQCHPPAARLVSAILSCRIGIWAVNNMIVKTTALSRGR